MMSGGHYGSFAFTSTSHPYPSNSQGLGCGKPSGLSLGHPSQCRLLGAPFPEGEFGVAPGIFSLQSTPFIPLCSHTVCIC